MTKLNLYALNQSKKRISVNDGVIMNNKSIEQVKENLFLGIVLDENLTWKLHISQVSNKVSRSIGVIRRAFCI